MFTTLRMCGLITVTFQWENFNVMLEHILNIKNVQYISPVLCGPDFSNLMSWFIY